MLNQMVKHVVPAAPPCILFLARQQGEKLGVGLHPGSAHGEKKVVHGTLYAVAIPRWQSMGYHIKLVFLQLPDVEAAIGRVAERVRQGGHHIPDATIRRRFDAGLINFRQLYKPLVDVWLHFDNAGDAPILVDWSER